MNETPNPRLVVVNDNKLSRLADGDWAFRSSKFHLFLRAFSRFAVTLSSPLAGGPAKRDERRRVDGVSVIVRPDPGSTQAFYAMLPVRAPRHYRAVSRHLAEADAALVVLPACTGILSWLAARRRGLNPAIYIVGDVREVVGQDRTRSVVSRMMARIAAAIEWRLTRYMAHRSLTFVLGSKLLNDLKAAGITARPAMTSLVSERSLRAPRLPAAKGALSIFTACRLSQEKGIETILQAMHASTGYRFDLAIAGDGPHREALEKRAGELGLHDRVRFLGWQDDAGMEAALAEADIFILASHSEGIPKIVLEAMAAGLPVIATRVGGIPDLIGTSEERGLLFTPGRADELLTALERTLAVPAETQARLEAASGFAREHSSEAEAAGIEAAIAETLSRVSARRAGLGTVPAKTNGEGEWQAR